jgi:hypothetical protein
VTRNQNFARFGLHLGVETGLVLESLGYSVAYRDPCVGETGEWRLLIETTWAPCLKTGSRLVSVRVQAGRNIGFPDVAAARSFLGVLLDME